MSTSKFIFSTLLTLLIFANCKTTQNVTVPDPQRFTDEIAKIKTISFDQQQDRVVFTGSSSIRFWTNVQEYYPDIQAINTGFGGSEMSDLLYYLEETVLRFSPSKVFIYEGDNDINSKRSLKTIMDNTKKVVQTIEKQFPNCEIILISAKPSVARWSLKAEYEALNKAFQKYATKKPNRYFADVWTVMLDNQGMVRKDIFIADNLHMNKTGYDLWDKVIREFVEE